MIHAFGTNKTTVNLWVVNVWFPAWCSLLHWACSSGLLIDEDLAEQYEERLTVPIQDGHFWLPNDPFLGGDGPSCARWTTRSMGSRLQRSTANWATTLIASVWPSVTLMGSRLLVTILIGYLQAAGAGPYVYQLDVVYLVLYLCSGCSLLKSVGFDLILTLTAWNFFFCVTLRNCGRPRVSSECPAIILSLTLSTSLNHCENDQPVVTLPCERSHTLVATTQG